MEKKCFFKKKKKKKRSARRDIGNIARFFKEIFLPIDFDPRIFGRIAALVSEDLSFFFIFCW